MLPFHLFPGGVAWLGESALPVGGGSVFLNKVVKAGALGTAAH